MNAYMAAFIEYVKEHPLKYADVDVDSLLEMFYECYCEYNPMETDRIRALFREMDETLPGGLQDDLFGLVSGLCAEQGRAAFLEGFRVGGPWVMELRQK